MHAAVALASTKRHQAAKAPRPGGLVSFTSTATAAAKGPPSGSALSLRAQGEDDLHRAIEHSQDQERREEEHQGEGLHGALLDVQAWAS